MRTLALCCVLSCVEPAHLARSCALARNGSGRKFGLFVASRNWPPTACAAARGALPDLDGLRSEAERKAARARKKLTKAEERAADCEQRQEELLTQVCADDVHMKLHPIMASTKPHRVERPPNCTRLGIHETNPFHTTKNIQLVPIRPHADHPNASLQRVSPQNETRMQLSSSPSIKRNKNATLFFPIKNGALSLSHRRRTPRSPISRSFRTARSSVRMLTPRPSLRISSTILPRTSSHSALLTTAASHRSRRPRPSLA
jgi:hypothetical protein